jgi:sugar phosphate isomerase/epimerase
MPVAVAGTSMLARQRAVPVGLELYSVRESLARDLSGTLTAVAKMGYQVVEFYSPYMTWSNDTARSVRQQLDDLGMTCPSLHTPASAFVGDTLQRAIELNQILGSRTMVMASPPRITNLDGWKTLAERCTRAVDVLRPLGMTAGYHNHAAEWRLVEGQRPMDIIAAGTPRDFVLQLDVGTCVEMGVDPVGWIEANPGRIRSMHCKDWGASRGFAVAFGEGDAPWARIFEAAEATGGIEYYLIEQEVPGPDGEFAMVRRCLDNYRKLRT